MTADRGHTWREWHDTDYLGSWDIEDAGGELTLTIDGYQDEDIFCPGEGKKQAEKIIRFRGHKKKLIGRPVIYKGIEKALGTPDYTRWIGQQITLTTEHGKWFGEERDAIRVKKGRPRRGTVPNIPTPPPPPPQRHRMQDRELADALQAAGFRLADVEALTARFRADNTIPPDGDLDDLRLLNPGTRADIIAHADKYARRDNNACTSRQVPTTGDAE